METGSSGQQYQDTLARDRLTQLGNLHATEYDFDGAKVVVDYAHIPLRENLQPSDKREVAIYLGGLPHNPAQNTGGDPQEVGMVANLLTGTASDLIVLKPEGLTASAYNNKAAPEKSATFKKLMEVCAEQGIDLQRDGNSITVYGFSEGSSQGASLALELQKQFGCVSRLVGIEPAGITGYADRPSSRIWPQSVEKFRQFLGAIFAKKDRQPVVKTDTGYRLSKELIASYSDIFEHTSKNKPKVDFSYIKDSVKNIGSFIRRLTVGVTGMKTPRGVQKDRLRHVWSQNADYGALAEMGVPITLFSGRKSQIIPFSEAEKWVRERRLNNQEVDLITSDTSHFDPNAISKGIGAALAFTQGKSRVAAT